MSIFNLDSKDIIYNPGEQGLHGKAFGPVKIPDDAMAGNNIFPDRVISSYNVPADESTPSEWERYMLSLAHEIPTATGVYWSSAINSGSTGGRYWFGYIFRGPPLKSKDFVPAPKKSEVVGARAYTILLKE